MNLKNLVGVLGVSVYHWLGEVLEMLHLHEEKCQVLVIWPLGFITLLTVVDCESHKAYGFQDSRPRTRRKLPYSCQYQEEIFMV